MNKKLRVVLAFAMCLAISLEEMPRVLAEEESKEELFVRIDKVLSSLKTDSEKNNKEYQDEERKKFKELEVSLFKSVEETNIHEELKEISVKANVDAVFSNLNKRNKEEEKLITKIEKMVFWLKFADEYVWENYLNDLTKISLDKLEKSPTTSDFNLLKIEGLDPESSKVLNLFIIKAAALYSEILTKNHQSAHDFFKTNICNDIPAVEKEMAAEIIQLMKSIGNKEARSESPYYGIRLYKHFKRNLDFYCENKTILTLNPEVFKSILQEKISMLPIIVKKPTSNTRDVEILISWMGIIYTSKDQRIKVFEKVMSLVDYLFGKMGPILTASQSKNSPFFSKLLTDFGDIIEIILKPFVPDKDKNEFYEDKLKVNLSYGSEALRTIHTSTGRRLFSSTSEEYNNFYQNLRRNFQMLLKNWTKKSEEDQIRFWEEMKDKSYVNKNCISMIFLFVLGTEETFFDNNFGKEYEFSFKLSLFRNFQCFYGKSSTFYHNLMRIMTLYEQDGKLNEDALDIYSGIHDETVSFILRNCIDTMINCSLYDFYRYIRVQEQTKSVLILYLKAYMEIQTLAYHVNIDSKFQLSDVQIKE
jgi:hypothetical protein